MNTTQCLQKITELTQQNLKILQTLNDSFFTKKTRLVATVDDTRYIIPSFISLENKFNHLQDAFNNLVHAPEAGEAWYNFDGSAREILCRSYQSAPNPITLTNTKTFGHETVALFKDIMTPQPYLDIDLSEMPDDIVKVVVKKIIPYNESLIANLSSYIESGYATGLIDYTTMVTELASGDPAYESGADYTEYESIYELPIRKMTCAGEYVVTEVIEDTIDDDAVEVLTLQISDDTPLTYTSFDGVTSCSLASGDLLTTYDGSCRLEVSEVYSTSSKIVVKVVHAEYVNIIASAGDEISDYSKLRFYKPSDFDSDKYVHIPIEEDEYVYIAVAPLNTRMNVQSVWGTGIFVHTTNLVDSDGTAFKKYYNANVTNIGDMINELAVISSPSITKYSSTEYAQFTESVPTLTEDTLDVVQINKHINDAESIQNIRSLYSQKQQYNTDLTEVNNKISALTSELAEVSFDDTSGTRAMYEGQISDLKSRQSELTASITTIINNISIAANDTTIPIEDAKYRVRGYVDIEGNLQAIFGDDWMDYLDLVQDVEVQYRYKNAETPKSNVDVINNFLFTNWVIYDTPDRTKTMSYDSGSYTVSFADADDNGLKETENEPKFNQVDIPISQGENVDIRARIVWSFGRPFAKITTAWSETLTVSFPDELVTDVSVVTIIEENNNDIEANRFTNILSNTGTTAHVDDALVDQDITYFHKPESIASGFYTDERRVIPLLDKLKEIDSTITEIQDNLQGTVAESLSVSLTVDETIHTLSPDIDNQIQLAAYNSIEDTDIATGTYVKSSSSGVISVMGVLGIANETEHTLYIFSMFPASRDQFIGSLANTKYDQTDFYNTNDDGEWIGQAVAIQSSDDDYSYDIERQRGNQFIAWRRTNPYDASVIYENSTICSYVSDFDNMSATSFTSLSASQFGVLNLDDYTAAASSDSATTELFGQDWVYACPFAQPSYNMCIESDATAAKLTIDPGETVTIPIIIKYYNMSSTTAAGAASYTMAFNIRNSLYSDPIYYQFTLNSKYTQSLTDSLASKKASIQSQTKYNVSVR